MTYTEQLRQWAINKIQTHYPEDIDLLIAISGLSVNNDGHGECFDYFIPATRRGFELAQTFILDGIGHDLYPRSWERMEATADCSDSSIFCLTNATIVYARNHEAELRFQALKDRLAANLATPEFVYKKALEQLDIAMDLYRTLMFEERIGQVKMAAGYITHYLSQSVAFLNGFITDAYCDNVKHASKLPRNFLTYKEAIICAQSINELRNLSHLLISTTRDFIQQQKPDISKKIEPVDYNALASWYHELSLIWRRIYYFSDTQNYSKAFSDACYLQSELNIIAEEFHLKEMDLLGTFQYNNLAPLKERARELEDYIIALLKNNSILIESYDTIEDFLQSN